MPTLFLFVLHCLGQALCLSSPSSRRSIPALLCNQNPDGHGSDASITCPRSCPHNSSHGLLPASHLQAQRIFCLSLTGRSHVLSLLRPDTLGFREHIQSLQHKVFFFPLNIFRLQNPFLATDYTEPLAG